MHAFDAMQLFVRIAELGSFSQAAAERGLPRSSASTAIRQLESMLGTQLLHRTTRKLRLTADGQQFHERCRDLLADFDETRNLFQQDERSLHGRLRVDMSSGIARRIVIPALRDFLRAHPQLVVELSSTDRRVDLVREGFDCVIRVGKVADSSLVARRIGAFEILTLASPDYLRERGIPRTLEDLAGHTLIHYAPSFGAPADGFEYLDSDGHYRTLAMPGALFVNNADAYQAACLSGLGLIQAPALGSLGALDAGALVEVLPAYRAEPMPVYLLYPHRRNLSRRVRVFMAWLETILRPHLMRADDAQAGTSVP